VGKEKGRGFIWLTAAGIVVYLLIALIYVLVFVGLDFCRILPPSLFILSRLVNWCGLIIIAAFCLLRVWHRSAGKLVPPVEGRGTIGLFMALVVSSIATYCLLGYRFQISRIFIVLLPESIVSSLRLPLLAVLLTFPLFLYFSWRVLLRVSYRGFDRRLVRFGRSALLKWSCVACLVLMLVLDVSAYVLWERMPDIVLITIDTLRQDHLGYAGYGRDTSPNMDKLRREGITFFQATSFSDWTMPAHENLLSGRYPASAMVKRVPDSIELLPEILKRYGYKTAAFVSGMFCSGRFGMDQGFDFFDDDFSSQRGIDKYYDGILRWLDRGAEKPFFLWLHLFEPHFPYVAHDRHVYEPSRPTEFDKYNKYFGDGKEMTRLWENRMNLGEEDIERAVSLYDGEIAYIDDYLGRFLGALRERGLFDSSMIVVTSDHGEGFGEHGMYFTHSYGVTDEMIMVPLIVKMPGNSHGGMEFEEQVRISDVFSTILDLVGIPYRDDFLSRSLLPLIRGDGGHEKRPAYSYSTNKGSYSVRDGRFKLVYYGKDGEYALHDLDSDPLETKDISADRPEVFREMKDELDSFRADFLLFTSEHEGEKPIEVDEGTRKMLQALGYIH